MFFCVLSQALNAVSCNDEELVEVSKRWVAAMIADMGVCPFTMSPEKAGLPLGQVHYPVSRASTAEQVVFLSILCLLCSESNPWSCLRCTLHTGTKSRCSKVRRSAP